MFHCMLTWTFLDQSSWLCVCQWRSRSRWAPPGSRPVSSPPPRYHLQPTPCPSSSSSSPEWQPQSSSSSASWPAADGGSNGGTERGKGKERMLSFSPPFSSLLTWFYLGLPQSDGEPDAERSAVGAAAGPTPPKPHVPEGSSAAQLQAAGPGVPTEQHPICEGHRRRSLRTGFPKPGERNGGKSREKGRSGRNRWGWRSRFNESVIKRE